jgi:hypothetical protein
MVSCHTCRHSGAGGNPAGSRQMGCRATSGGGTRSRASARASSTGVVCPKPAVEVELDPPATRALGGPGPSRAVGAVRRRSAVAREPPGESRGYPLITNKCQVVARKLTFRDTIRTAEWYPATPVVIPAQAGIQRGPGKCVAGLRRGRDALPRVRKGVVYWRGVSKTSGRGGTRPSRKLAAGRVRLLSGRRGGSGTAQKFPGILTQYQEVPRYLLFRGRYFVRNC